VNGENIEHLELNGSALTGTGNALNNSIGGTDGNNTLNGNAGNDILRGFKGTDTLNGGDNDDVLEGGDGADAMTGGAGNDVFFYQLSFGGTLADLSGDTITGFEHGKDTVDLATLFRDLSISRDDAVGAGFLTLQTLGGNTLVKLDADGSAGGGGAITLVTLTGVTDASIADVLF